ncbi:MAG: bifunctional N-acetylglucosamine-1-phosphate uridyltransferase/glucosamine-1-phosphate acetyltransferase [Nitrospirae bacterium]|nr:bifunctional N-acetylglucosamine-1-phosphate uridyltransferase/glucosamine-1-phosphate acetyltransferase [Nitrospirota bacterium]
MKICAVILAAGRGKRMNSLKPKVLHEVLGRPMIQYTIDAVRALKPQKLIMVINPGASEEMRQKVKDSAVSFVLQKKLLGTGNALAEAKNALKNIKNCTIIVLNGDSPLITADTLKSLLNNHSRNRNDLSFLSFRDESLSGYGRVLRDEQGRVAGIIEDKHATQGERKIAKELNSGVYAIEPGILDYLYGLKMHGASGEYYLTDIVEIASKRGKKIDAYKCPAEEVRGVNTRAELSQVTELLNRKIISGWMQDGVTFIDPSSSIVHPAVSIGKDTVIYPNTYLEGNTSIGGNCVIYPGVRIYNSIIGGRVTIKDNTLIESSKIVDGMTVGPLAYLKGKRTMSLSE